MLEETGGRSTAPGRRRDEKRGVSLTITNYVVDINRPPEGNSTENIY